MAPATAWAPATGSAPALPAAAAPAGAGLRFPAAGHRGCRSPNDQRARASSCGAQCPCLASRPQLRQASWPHRGPGDGQATGLADPSLEYCLPKTICGRLFAED
ncbi:MAG TPA: hypothetical protein DDY43_08340 [Synechococcales bacterium UBA10510]|nr:hypothetical protein [Synechococcales bacterium UBA10510]